MTIRPAGGIAAAIVTIVVLPVLITQAVQPPPEKPAPKEGALTIQLSEEEVQGDDGALLRVKAAGPPPAPTALLNSDGTEVVPLESAPGKCGEDLPVHQALGSGASEEWCLQLSGIEDSTQVAGKAAGTGTVLTLTVNRRPPFFCGPPILVVLGGLLIGLLLLVVPLWLSKKIRQGLLDKVVSDNEAKGPGEKIEGLANWVKKRRAAGQKDNDLLPVVDQAIRALPRAREGREELRQRLASSKLADSHHYRGEAANFLKEREALKVGDLLSSDGKFIGPYPTDPWLEGLEKLERQRIALLRLRERANGMESGEPRTKVEKALDEAELAFNAIARPGAVDGFDAKLDAVHASFPDELAVEVAALSMPSMVGWRAAGPERAMLVLGAEPVEAAPPASELASPDKLLLYQLGTGALILFVIAFAILTLKQEVYEPVADFGDFADYFALASAAIGAGVSATVVGLLAPWNKSEPTA